MHLIRLDPVRSPATAPLTGIFGQRIRAFAAAHSPFQNPDRLVQAIMTRLWQGDEGLFAMLFVDEHDGRDAGHVLATCTPGEDWAFVMQTKADGNVGDAVKQAEAQVVQWAQERGKVGLWMATHRNPESWAKRYGYKVSQTVMCKRFEEASA